MDPDALRPLALLVLGMLLFARSLRVVREPERLLVFRLGRLRQVAGPGLVWLVPWVDRGLRVNLDEAVPHWRSLAPQALADELLRHASRPAPPR
jgi:regulator of protease activity HflC (stomatin/prohibitin superfamily)